MLRIVRGCVVVASFFFASLSYASDELKAVGYLRTYCKSCHALGRLNFLPYDSDLKNLEFIKDTETPNYNNWREGILMVLAWPNIEAPAAPIGQGRDYMPKGSRRYEIGVEKLPDGRSVREFILDALE